MTLILRIAIRGLFAQRLSLGVAVIAVAIGVGFQIPNSANLAGSSSVILDEELVWGRGDVRVEPRTGDRFAGGAIAARIKNVLGDHAQAVTPLLVLAGAIGSRGRFDSVPVVGVSFDELMPPVRIARGVPLGRSDGYGVAIGSALARDLHLEVGDSLELRVVLDRQPIGAYTMVVRAVAANSALYRSVIVDREWLASELAGAGDSAAARDTANALAVVLDDHGGATDAARTIEAAIAEVRATPWHDDERFLVAILGANRVIGRVSYAMVLAAIAVPLLAVFYIRALRRRRDSAILRAIGFSRGEVLAIAVAESIGAAVIGCGFGLMIGGAAVIVFDHYPLFSWEGTVVRPLASIATFGIPAGAALVVATIAGAFTAWRANRMPVARILQRLD